MQPAKLPSLAALAAKRKPADGGNVKTSPTGPVQSQSIATPVSSLKEKAAHPSPKTSKLAQKIKLASSASQHRNSHNVDSVSAAHENQGSGMENKPTVPSPSISPALFTAIAHSLPKPPSPSTVPPMAVAEASSFGSLLADEWKPVTNYQSKPSILLNPQTGNFMFDSPSPDDIVEAKRLGTRLGKAGKGRGGP